MAWLTIACGEPAQLAPVPSPSPAIDANELMSVESLPLQFPIVAPGSPCPVSTPIQGLGMTYGDGPVHLSIVVGVTDHTDWGYWIAPEFGYQDTKPGLVLIRARDLKSDAAVAFAKYPFMPTGIVPAGSMLGFSDVVNHHLQLRSEAALLDIWHVVPIDKQGHLPPLIVLFGMRTGNSGCIGFQIDGPGFTENVVLSSAVLGR